MLGAERGHGGGEERSLGDQERTTLLAGLGWAGLGALPERGGGAGAGGGGGGDHKGNQEICSVPAGGERMERGCSAPAHGDLQLQLQRLRKNIFLEANILKVVCYKPLLFIAGIVNRTSHVIKFGCKENI